MKRSVCVVVPAFNEQDTVPLFYDRMAAVAGSLPQYRWTVLFVDDGSTDGTLARLTDLARRDARVGVLALSRNFGKEAALTAGLDHADADAVAIFDADLQDPPELLPAFVHQWEAGYDVVYGRRGDRDGDSWLKMRTAAAFYRVMAAVSRVRIPSDTGDCRLLSRRAVDAVRALREQHRFMKGLFAWIGFPSIGVDYRRAPRAAGNTKFSYWKLWNFALEGITSFSSAPLKIATYLGIAVALLAFCRGLWIVAKTLIWGEPVTGYPTLMVTLLFLGGVQLFFTGVLGEYLGRVFGESKGRPLYIVSGYTRPAALADYPDGSRP